MSCYNYRKCSNWRVGEALCITEEGWSQCVLPGLMVARSFTHSLIARSLDGVDADSSSEAGAEAFSYFSKAGRPLCLHLCPVLSVLFILFFPKTCPFLPESYHTVPLCLDLNYSHVLSRRGHKNCQCDPRVSRSILRPCVLVSIDECP